MAQFRASSKQNEHAGLVKPQQTDIRAFTDCRQTPKFATPQKREKTTCSTSHSKHTPKRSKQTPGTPKQASTMPKQASKTPKQTSKTPKRTPTSRTPKQISKPTDQTSRIPIQTQKCTPCKSVGAKITPSKIKRKNSEETCTLDIQMSTPGKAVKSSKKPLKRKLNTPVRNRFDNSIASPCRKMQRRVSPRKLAICDIYRDPEEISVYANLQKNNIDVKDGLQERDMNVHASANLSIKSPAKLKPTKPSTTNPIKSKANVSNQHEERSFKVPLPVGKSPTPRRSVHKKICTSTPVDENVSRTRLIQESGPSPIQNPISLVGPRYGKPDSSRNGCSFSLNKTPLGTNQRTNNSSSLSSFATSSTPSFMNSNSCTSFGRTSYSDTKMKVTPPLCNCGRRAKRRMVQSPGQNMGRFFFTCATRHGAASKSGCDFFKWESSLRFNRNAMEKNVSKQFTPVMGNKSASASQKRSLGVRSTNTQRVFLR